MAVELTFGRAGGLRIVRRVLGWGDAAELVDPRR